MTIAELNELFEYNAWANAQMFEALRGTERKALTREITSSFPSILDTLTHIVSVEWVWLERFNGLSPSGLPEWAADPGLETLLEKLDGIERARARYLASIGEENLEAMVTYTNVKGVQKSFRLADLMRHVVNHSTYHRGQLVTMMRQAGVKAPSTDLTVFLESARGA